MYNCMFNCKSFIGLCRSDWSMTISSLICYFTFAGLDARAAAIVMRSVKNVSRNGRTVMVTIHQPSIEIFEGFDALFLLQRGGRVSPCSNLSHHCLNRLTAS